MSFQDSNQGQQPFAPPQQSWGAPQQQQQPGYGYGQPQDYAQQSLPQQSLPQQGFPQQGYQNYQNPVQNYQNPVPGYQNPAYPGQGYPNGQPGYPPQQSDFGSGGYGYPQQPQGNSGLATTALWLGILGGWGLINLVIAILAINDTGPGKKLGRNKAVIGLCLTLAWTVAWVGIAFAVSSSSKGVAATAAPSYVAASTTAAGGAAGTQASAGTRASASSAGGAGVSATGASSDPGCQAAQSAFNTYNRNATSGGLKAITTLGEALQSAAGQSRTAGSQLRKAGQDYIDLASATTPSDMLGDLEALDTACGMTFTAD